MNCPRCTSADIQNRGKRNALYPVGLVAFIGIPFAMLHQVSSPMEFHCKGCESDFVRRTTIGKIARVILWFFVVGFIALCALIVFAIAAAGIS